MSGDEYNQEEIVTERQKEEGGIQYAKDDKPERTDMKKHPEKSVEKGVHT
jgi:hypothetical protein